MYARTYNTFLQLETRVQILQDDFLSTPTASRLPASFGGRIVEINADGFV
jgi:hypothetical protein